MGIEFPMKFSLLGTKLFVFSTFGENKNIKVLTSLLLWREER